MTEESSIISRCKERFATAESRLNFGLCEVPSRAVLLKLFSFRQKRGAPLHAKRVFALSLF